MIKYIRGNLFDTEAEIIAHGVNCSGGFASGVAGQIAKIYPIAQKEYFRKFKNGGWTLGECQIVDINYSNKHDRDNKINLKYVANVASQQEFGGTKVHANYPAIRKGLEQVFRFAKCINCRVAMPRIGCGLANGDWKEVQTILVDLVQQYEIDVEVYSL